MFYNETMFKIFVPFAHAKSIYDIPMDFYKKLGIKTVLMDLDNTLDSYRLFTPTQKAFELINKFITEGITPIVISNNKGKRVSSYANALGINYINSARKPFPKRLKHFVKEHDLNPDEVIFVGDQLITDVLATHFAGLRIVLTEKLVKEDQFTTHFNRLLDKPIRRYLAKHGKLRDWSEI